MIEVLDRVPTYPGRVKLIPVAGQANTYDMVRADEPIEPGTPINRALFQAFIDEMNAIRQQVDDKLFEMSQRTRIGDLADGTVFGLYENGMLVPFIKFASNYSSSGRVGLVRKNCVTADVLANEGETNYRDCRTDRWLNNEYISTLDAATQGVLNLVNFPVDSTTASRKVFLLSTGDYNQSYFSTPERRIATLAGTPIKHWTRTKSTSNTSFYYKEDGTNTYGSDYTIVAGIRPAFTLPPDFEVTVGLPSTENVMATSEVV